MRKALVFALSLCACSASLKQQAHIAAQSSKQVVDGLYGGWDEAANDRVSACEKKLQPPEDYTKSDYDKCAGPYNEQVQEKIVLALKAVTAKQLVVYIALVQDKSSAEVRQAMLDLARQVNEFIQLVQENQ